MTELNGSAATIDLADCQPTMAMRFIAAAISQMGGSLLRQTAKQEAAERGTLAQAEYESYMGRIGELATAINETVAEMVSEDESFGVVLLSTLQVAMWNMERYIHLEEECDADAAAESLEMELASSVESDETVTVAPEGTTIQEDTDEGSVRIPSHGVLVRGKSRGDH